uniref:Tubulin--tyrosine ligase-like protein 12 n=2 Tax=Cacopsylla melanoneura TaxID=428564 RepID=A0A8D8WLB0_9HEMI
MAGDSSFSEFLDNHKQQLMSHAIPIEFWETLCKKLKHHIFDAGNSFSVLKFDYSDNERTETDPLYKVVVSNDNGIKKDDPTNIYLIDHAWTYSITTARQDLRDNPNLLDRMSNLMGIDPDKDTEDKVEQIFTEMWKYNNTYSVKSMQEGDTLLPVWYIMDEFGSAVQHSDEPTMRIVPFIYLNEGIAYSILYPVSDLENEDEITVDYVESYQDPEIRKVLLHPWFPNSYCEIDFNQIEPGADYFSSGHIAEEVSNSAITRDISIPGDKTLKVYSEYKYINENLTYPRFVTVDNEEEADILWYTHHFKDFKTLTEQTPNKFVNQFPFEYILTIKDLLSIICRRNSKDMDKTTLQTTPEWLPTTYNLKTELLKFMSYYQNREKKGLNNLWIIKPFNLARSLDSYITDNINMVIKSALSGPKIVQKYIENPILFYRDDLSGKVKFDIRYVILVSSVKPLKVFLYKNFFLRFANKLFTLSNFDDYEMHFTVMNYDDKTPLCKMLCSDFKTEFEKQNPSESWDHIESKIINMFRSVFEAATMKDPPLGLAHNVQSRSLYAADLMLTKQNHEIVPQLLEINWMPDCARACQYYPDFYNDVFSLLFLNQPNVNVFHEL